MRYTVYNETADKHMSHIDPECEVGFSSARKQTNLEHIENFFEIERVLAKDTDEALFIWLQELKVSEVGLTRIDREKFINECPK